MSELTQEVVERVLTEVEVVERILVEEVAAIRGPRGPQGETGGTVDLSVHELDLTPHPAYDDMPDLALIFENGLI